MIDTSWIQSELAGLHGEAALKEMGEIVKLYDCYEGQGQQWSYPSELDYVPTRKRTNFIKKLIKAEARFMFARTPEFSVRPADPADREAASAASRFLQQALTRNRIGMKLLGAARDCLIGKRVALRLWVGPDGVEVGVRPSLEFVYETDPCDTDRLTKIIFFYGQNDAHERSKQRMWRQKFELRDGQCLLWEGVYDGAGRLLECTYDAHDTGLDFIPAYVIVNDGLTGDLCGESDVSEVWENQLVYNRLTSDDIDALRFNMFPQRVAVDASQASLAGMVVAPGALIDLQTDPALAGGRANLEMLEPKFGYDGRFEHALNRIKSDMYELLSVPNIGLEQLHGAAQSGKALKALYWDLMCRCEEKWAAWEPALRWMAENILTLSRRMGILRLPAFNYSIHIEHLYPLTEDEESERMNDLREVEAGVRAPRSYREKWGIAEERDPEDPPAEEVM